jgi:hypothetical protein
MTAAMLYQQYNHVMNTTVVSFSLSNPQIWNSNTTMKLFFQFEKAWEKAQ